jgi:hypothetical protein
VGINRAILAGFSAGESSPSRRPCAGWAGESAYHPLVTLNLFQGPFLRLDRPVWEARWMLKRVQHDDEGCDELQFHVTGIATQLACQKRNGAGIAADPTLTGVWSSVRKNLTPGVSLHREGRPRNRSYVARRSRRHRFRLALANPFRRTSSPLPGETATEPSLGAFRFRDCETEVSPSLPLPAERSDRYGCAPIPILRLRSASILRLSRVACFPDRAAFTAASKVVPKSLLFSGCYPVHPKSQSPLSMI